MRFDFTYTNENLTINTTGAVEGSTTFQVEMGKVFKGDKGDSGTASYSPKIDSGTNTWWTWNDTTQGYIDTGIKAESTDLFLKKTNVIIYNITNEIPLGAGFFYTLSTAITATPVANRKKGLILMFESASGIIEAYQFKSIVANWTNQSYWEIVFKTGTYGSNLVSNFDTISKSGWHTGYSGTIGQPYNSGTSWFVLHENSAVGLASAYQIAVAFSTTMIMCFRIKQASAWGAWENISPSLKQDKTAVSLYNITNEIPLPAGSYYTLATAIAAIPTNIRKLGLKITFQVSATNTETWEFFNSTIANITNVAYWRKTANSTDLDLKIDKEYKSIINLASKIGGRAINSDGSILSNGNYSYYKITNDNYIKIIGLASSYTGFINVAFYSEEPNIETFISGKTAITSYTLEYYSLDVPSNCKYILISEHISTISSCETELYLSYLDNKIKELNEDTKDSFDTKIDKTAIKQALGTSPTDVMSQKSITEAINSLNLTVSIPLGTGLYYSLTTAIASVPSALRKIGFEITFESEAGIWEKYKFVGLIEDWLFLDRWINYNNNYYPVKNYLSMADFIINKYIESATGEEKLNVNFGYFTLPINAASFYFLDWNIANNQTGAYFDINGNYISKIDYSGGAIINGTKWCIKTPIGATTIKINVLNSNIYSNIFIKDITPLLINEENRNIYDYPHITNLSNIDRLLDINFGYITSVGNILPSPDFGMTIPIACQEGDIFKISNYLTDVTSPTSVSSRGVILNSNFQMLQQLPVINSYSPEYSMPANAAYVSFNYMTAKSSELIIERIFSPIIISKLPKSIIYEENVLKGKRWVSFGDSLTYRNLWQPYVLSEIALEHTNCGIGSTFLSGTSSTAFWQNSRLDVVKAADPEIITILGGANDLTQDSPIGTDAEFDAILSSKNTSNFKGAYSYIIENLLTWKPSLKIIILTTSFAHLGGAAYSPSGNMRYYMYADASREVANHYGLPVVDLYQEMGINKLTQSVYTSDAIHWNDAGAKVVASLVISKIKEIINK